METLKEKLVRIKNQLEAERALAEKEAEEAKKWAESLDLNSAMPEEELAEAS